MTTKLDLVRIASERLGYTFRDPKLLLRATTHKSFSNEFPAEDDVGHNERLEFLGDAVLNLVTSQMLMDSYPGANEGKLSRMRAFLVNERELARTALHLGLGDLLRLGKGEESSGGRTKTSLLANLFEATLGAVFLEEGLPAARNVVERALGPRIDISLTSFPGFDPKSRLQEIFQQQGRPHPSYRLVKVEGPEHERSFTVLVMEGDTELGQGVGKSKKEAERSAAIRAIERIASSELLVQYEEEDEK